MTTRQIILLVINIIGGILVIGSYVLGLKSGSGADVLWGGVPVNWRKLYTASMIVCAVSYFIFFFYILLNVESGSPVATHPWGGWLFHLLFVLILLPSALWMPLTNVMASNPGDLVWIGIRVVLVLVALGSLGITIGLLTLSPRPTGLFYWSSVVGIAWFFLHTGVLDAILWPYFWVK